MQPRIDARVAAAREDGTFRDRLIDATLPAEYRDLARLQGHYEGALLELDFVQGVAIGASQDSTRGRVQPVPAILLDQITDEKKAQVSERLDDALQNTDFAPDDRSRFRALQFTQVKRITARQGLSMPKHPSLLFPALQNFVRPVVGGVRIGPQNGSGSGTLGICCYDENSLAELSYMLSNNHVLADLNNATIGIPIMQPGPEGGIDIFGTKIIGSLAGYVPLLFTNQYPGSTNYVDAAIAAGAAKDLDGDIHEIGSLLGCTYAPALLSPVQKTGAYTGHTIGEIEYVYATIKIDYGASREAWLANQIIVRPHIANDGDSGSLLVSDDKRAVGLIFAEDEEDSHIYANSILLVETFLGIRVSPYSAPTDLGLP